MERNCSTAIAYSIAEDMALLATEAHSGFKHLLKTPYQEAISL